MTETNPAGDATPPSPPPWGPGATVLLAAMAGGMGWGIRGSFGHETGAMIAGVLVGCVLVRGFVPGASSLRGARAVALLALGISFGGSMTYGRTLGLAHAPGAVGQLDALRWGLLGCAIKGAIWFGFGGLFLGMGLGRTRYRAAEGLAMVAGMLALARLGIWLFNEPFDPSRGLTPRWFFSPGAWPPPAGPDPGARREVWGGLLVALGGAWAYCRLARGDVLAGRLALAGCLAGGLGFATGEGVQAFHAWNRPLFAAGGAIPVDPNVNWWTTMEITFGAIGGAGLALGLARSRGLVATPVEGDPVELGAGTEYVLAALHAALLAGAEFSGDPRLSWFLSLGPTVAWVALPAILGGRSFPYLFALPLVALPIAGKALRRVVVERHDFSPGIGWGVLVIVPLALTLLAAILLERSGRRGDSAGGFAGRALLLSSWLYFGLCFAMYEFPRPWAPWSGRATSATVYLICLAFLTTAALRASERKAPGADSTVKS